MDNDLFELDLQEDEPADRPPGEPVSVKRRTPPSRLRRRTRRSRGNLLLVIFAVIALLIASAILPLILRRDDPPELPPEIPAEDEPVTFQFGDMTLTPLEGMPRNSYDKDAFDLDENGRVTYELDGLQAKMGVDVSTHQKDIDWQAVAADGIDFAILRLGNRGYTEGGLYLDPTFEQNFTGALDAGLEVGVYFFSQAVTPEEAEEEADYILDVLGERELTFPIVFDWEFIHEGSGTVGNHRSVHIVGACLVFVDKFPIEEAGRRPAVYFNRTQGYLVYDLRKLKDYTLWLAEYETVPDFYYHFDIWQYSDTGRVDGIQGNVDLDLSFEP